MTDVGAIIESSGCAKEYFRLEECLGENDRDFRLCKEAMNALKVCSDAQRVAKAARHSAGGGAVAPVPPLPSEGSKGKTK